MVVQAHPSTHHFSLTKPLTNNIQPNHDTSIPVIDLSRPDEAISLAVEACREFGFFKVVNHGVGTGIVQDLEDEAARFFGLRDSEKEKASLASPFGYGNKRIGPNGDVGWVEYLLLSASRENVSKISNAVFPDDPRRFRVATTSYIEAVKGMACRVLEMLAEGLKVGRKDAFSRMLKDEQSDSCFRLNHYPPCPETVEMQLSRLLGAKLIGFGEHTDPQIISILRSNNTEGLQILKSDGNWVSVPPDSHSFFVIVGDTLQAMTNGRFKSVKHRVLAEGLKSRISMIYFGGPPPGEKIAPLASLMEEGEESLYEEFTWWEYKKAAYKSKLGENRLGMFKRERH
ncbi:hypothetical protein Droror1_Dr00022818 [Drosera rotundifolia]